MAAKTPTMLQSALIGTQDGNIRLCDYSPVPEVPANAVLIKVKAVSVNPADSKMTGAFVTPGAVAGNDVAGVVEKVGSDVAGVKVGDRVSTSVMGMNPLKPTVGAFAEYTTALEHLLLKLPPTISLEEGASVPISFTTAALGLFHHLGLPGGPLEPTSNVAAIKVLVYGGSSATGTAAIQLLKLAGFEVLTTCSPHNFDLVRGYGADIVFDYKAPDCATEIRKQTRNCLKYVLDCISTLSSMQFCYQAMGRAGGKYTALEPFPEAIARTRRVIKDDWVMALQALGHDIAWPEPHFRPADEAITKFGVAWAKTMNELLARGLVRTHPLIIREGGLNRVLEGIEDVRSKKFSGKKLVVTL
ncbi:hypothetical protein BDV06DRAFT_231406 [Aspergillus oleicola]